MILEACDIVFLRSRKPFLGLSWASLGLVSGSGSVGGDAVILPPLVIAASPLEGVVEQEVFPSAELAVARPVGLSESDRDRIVAKARSMLRQEYSWWVVPLLFLGLGRFLPRRWGGRWNLCSPVVGRSYAAAGLTFGQLSETLGLSEIFEYVGSHPKEYSWIVPP